MGQATTLSKSATFKRFAAFLLSAVALELIGLLFIGLWFTVYYLLLSTSPEPPSVSFCALQCPEAECTRESLPFLGRCERLVSRGNIVFSALSIPASFAGIPYLYLATFGANNASALSSTIAPSSPSTTASHLGQKSQSSEDQVRRRLVPKSDDSAARQEHRRSSRQIFCVSIVFIVLATIGYCLEVFVFDEYFFVSQIFYVGLLLWINFDRSAIRYATSVLVHIVPPIITIAMLQALLLFVSGYPGANALLVNYILCSALTVLHLAVERSVHVLNALYHGNISVQFLLFYIYSPFLLLQLGANILLVKGDIYLLVMKSTLASSLGCLAAIAWDFYFERALLDRVNAKIAGCLCQRRRDLALPSSPSPLVLHSTDNKSQESPLRAEKGTVSTSEDLGKGTKSSPQTSSSRKVKVHKQQDPPMPGQTLQGNTTDNPDTQRRHHGLCPAAVAASQTEISHKGDKHLRLDQWSRMVVVMVASTLTSIAGLIATLIFRNFYYRRLILNEPCYKPQLSAVEALDFSLDHFWTCLIAILLMSLLLVLLHVASFPILQVWHEERWNLLRHAAFLQLIYGPYFYGRTFSNLAVGEPVC